MGDGEEIGQWQAVQAIARAINASDDPSADLEAALSFIVDSVRLIDFDKVAALRALADAVESKPELSNGA